jgi:hypothetical protein
MEFDTAVRQIVVLEENGQGLSRIWPVPEGLEHPQGEAGSGAPLANSPTSPDESSEPVLEILDE